MIRKYQNHFPELGKQVYIDEQACVIGKVFLGDDVSVWPMSVIRGDVNTITIGARTNIQDGAVLHVTHDGPYTPGGRPLIIGEEVTIGHQAMLHACTIGNRVLIGMQAIVLDDAVIEDEVLLGAGSLVPPGKRLSSGHLWFGNPVKCIRALTLEEITSLRYSAEHYVKLKNNYFA